MKPQVWSTPIELGGGKDESDSDSDSDWMINDSDYIKFEIK